MSSADTLFSGGLPAQASDLNLAISFNGTSLVSDGSAVANSGTAGDRPAIAYGEHLSHAFATGGTGDYALAIGQPAGPEDAEADAYAGNATLATVPGTGSHDSAIAINGIAAAGDGNNDSAYADGGSAFAGSGNFDSASESAVNDFAFAGGMPGVQAGLPLSANNDIADVIGNNSSAVAGFNEFGPLTADPTVGNSDIAAVLGVDNVTANATGADSLYDIVTALGHETGTAAATSGGNLLTDFLSLF